MDKEIAFSSLEFRDGKTTMTGKIGGMSLQIILDEKSDFNSSVFEIINRINGKLERAMIDGRSESLKRSD